jgi:translation initiation factor IF-3
VLSETKEQLGVMSLNQALRLAQERGLDLVEIAPSAVPPVCRIVNYGKLMYEEAKNHKESRHAGPPMKEIQLRPGIEPHDFQTKLNHGREFLEDGSLVKVSLRFRGRELRHPERGVQVVEKFVVELAAFGNTEAPPKRVDRNLHVILRPLPKHQRGKGALPKTDALSVSPGRRTPDQVTEPPNPQAF